jgi:hypothetical protein
MEILERERERDWTVEKEKRKEERWVLQKSVEREALFQI